MEIYVRMSDGTTEAVEVEQEDTVQTIINKLYPNTEQIIKLLFSCRVLDHRELLSDTGISSESLLDVEVYKNTLQVKFKIRTQLIIETRAVGKDDPYGKWKMQVHTDNGREVVFTIPFDYIILYKEDDHSSSYITRKTFYRMHRDPVIWAKHVVIGIRHKNISGALPIKVYGRVDDIKRVIINFQSLFVSGPKKISDPRTAHYIGMEHEILDEYKIYINSKSFDERSERRRGTHIYKEI